MTVDLGQLLGGAIMLIPTLAFLILGYLKISNRLTVIETRLGIDESRRHEIREARDARALRLIREHCKEDCPAFREFARWNDVSGVTRTDPPR